MGGRLVSMTVDDTTYLDAYIMVDTYTNQLQIVYTK